LFVGPFFLEDAGVSGGEEAIPRGVSPSACRAVEPRVLQDGLLHVAATRLPAGTCLVVVVEEPDQSHRGY
jgi:hypothetical protein